MNTQKSADVVAHKIIAKALSLTANAIDQVFGENYAIKNPYLVARLIPSVMPIATSIVQCQTQEIKLGEGADNEK